MMSIFLSGWVVGTLNVKPYEIMYKYKTLKRKIEENTKY